MPPSALSRFTRSNRDSALCTGAAQRLGLAGLLLVVLWAAVAWAIR